MSNYYNNNNFNGGNGFNPYAQKGTSFQTNASAQNMPIMTQFLNDAQMELLKKKPNTISSTLTQIEYYTAICTHKDKKGNPKIEDIGGGRVRCSICGKVFRPLALDTPIDEIKRIIADCDNLWQNIKFYWGNAPTQMKDVFMAIAFNEKAPEFWDLAVKYFTKIQETFNNNNEIYNGYNDNTFNTLSHLIGGSNMFGGYNNPFMMNNGYQNMYPPNNMGMNMGNPAMNNMGMNPNYYNNNNYQANNVPNYNNYNPNPNQQMNNNPNNQANQFAMPNNPIGYHERPMNEMNNNNTGYGINSNTLVQNANNNKVTAMGEVPIPGYEQPAMNNTNEQNTNQTGNVNPAIINANSTGTTNPNLKQPTGIKIEKKFQG